MCCVLGRGKTNMGLVLKVPLVPVKNVMDGDGEHGVRALWSWGFGN